MGCGKCCYCRRHERESWFGALFMFVVLMGLWFMVLCSWDTLLTMRDALRAQGAVFKTPLDFIPPRKRSSVATPLIEEGK